MTAPTKYQIGLLQHTIGISEFNQASHRNHFVAGKGHSDMPHLELLCGMALMERARRPAFLPEDDVVFRVTEEGRRLAVAALPEPKKRTRYEEYLDADGCAGDSFGEFLCGIRLPQVETRDHWTYGMPRSITQYRMYRQVWDSYYRIPGGRDVQGEWAATKKDAKASYKAALKMRQKAQRAALSAPVGSAA